jgi:NADPH-dependent curcumin reductase CurA
LPAAGRPLESLQVSLLRDVGFDAAFNYHTTPKEQALKEAAPDGIDIYW